jgi:hypothetical protein
MYAVSVEQIHSRAEIMLAAQAQLTELPPLS